ncbi:hypothetical protein V8F06_002577 [Rhypophila decipiens]
MDKPRIATSSPSSRNKRKRKTENAVPSSFSTNGHGNTIPLAEGTVNPFSHSPSTIEQFTLAGLSIDAPVPSSIYPHFPHKPIPGAAQPKKDENTHCVQAEADNVAAIVAATDDEDKSGGTKTNEEALFNAYQKRFGVLLEIVRKGLDERDITMAKEAFWLFKTSEYNGRMVDLRYAWYWDSGLLGYWGPGFIEYWKLGLKIIQLEGEVAEQERWERWECRRTGIGREEESKDEEDGVDEEDEEEARFIFAKRRMADLLKSGREYYSELIARYPWNRLRSDVSSLVFYPAMFRFVLECVLDNHTLDCKRLERLRNGMVVSDEEGDEDCDNDSISIDQHRQSQNTNNPSYYNEEKAQSASSMNRANDNKQRGIIDRPADHIRLRTWKALRNIEDEIDSLPTLPYQQDYELLSIRAVIAFQVADLSVHWLYPDNGLATPLDTEQEEVQKSKEYKLKKLSQALNIFTRMKQIRKRPLDEKDEAIMEEAKKELYQTSKDGEEGGNEGLSSDDEKQKEEEEMNKKRKEKEKNKRQKAKKKEKWK